MVTNIFGGNIYIVLQKLPGFPRADLKNDEILKRDEDKTKTNRKWKREKTKNQGKRDIHTPDLQLLVEKDNHVYQIIVICAFFLKSRA